MSSCFADDTFLFSIVSYALETANILNKDLGEIRGRAEQWKMAFNPDPAKQAREMVFSKKPQESFHPNLYFNKFVAEKVQTQKHLGLKDNFKGNFSNVNGGMGILKKMSEFLPR